eukprot:4116660-Prymnesium_polylepis.2
MERVVAGEAAVMRAAVAVMVKVRQVVTVQMVVLAVLVVLVAVMERNRPPSRHPRPFHQSATTSCRRWG